VEPDDIDELKQRLARLYESDSDLYLHAGDCAETFESCTTSRVERDVGFLSESSEELGSPGFVLGRICGQFGKPRSYSTELHPSSSDHRIPVYRGDIINGVHHDSRTPDAHRMIKAHSICRSMSSTIQSTPRSPRVYTSHECLLLPYESALVREAQNRKYATSAHFLWIGDRTRHLSGAHVEFCRGIENPIGIKVGPSANPCDIAEIVRTLNPDNELGKITIITRFGSGVNIRARLSDFIHAMKGLAVLWQCDPMHGNTVLLNEKYKTRYVRDILNEIHETVITHNMNQSRLHGIHLEATGGDVTECVDGTIVREDEVPDRYETACDPRLNPEQTKIVLRFVADIVNSDKMSRLSTNTTAPHSDYSSPDDNA
jgi:3-deoxy-7-phosphoheptulonate synthase